MKSLIISPKQMHRVTFIVGMLFLIYSVISAVVFRYPHFYTSFALGSWLVLDYIDHRLTNHSILGFFYNHRHRLIFFLFFVLATIFCIIVDYIYGVRISGMWVWVDYKAIHFVRMYVFMNASYVLGMYELYRVVRHLLSAHILETHVFKFKMRNSFKSAFSKTVLASGMVFMLSPLYVIFSGTDAYIEYVMLLPFLSILMVSDSITYLTGGTPISRDIFRGNILLITSLLLTVLIASFITEVLNLFGGEWSYMRMPFMHIQLWGIPIAVFIGWIPLVVSSVAIVNLTKHLGVIKDHSSQ